MMTQVQGEGTGANPVRSICIVGGGTAGWSAAALLARVLRGSGCRITLVESSDIPTVGVGEATIPPIFDFLRNIGADEVAFIRRCQATFKLGIQFRDWLHRGHSYWHPFGNLGVTINQRPFHHYYWKNLAEGHDEGLADLCPSVALAEDNKFAFPSPDGNWPGGAVAYALHFDAGLVAAFLREHAEAAGVERLDRRILRAERGEGEHIAAVHFDNGESLSADFYIDCSGFRGLLIEEALEAGFDDWRRWLPCDRAVAAPTAAQSVRAPYTVATARSAGWQWRIPLQHRTGNGLVYCSDFIRDDDAAEELREGLGGPPIANPRVLRFTPGLRKRVWIGNCLALGLSAGVLEPLESTSIHLIQRAVLRILRMLPAGAISPRDIAEFNDQQMADMEQIRDFLILHYKATDRRDTPFWRHCASMSVPDSLTHRIELFRETGRIFRKNEELFAENSWVQVMMGQGVTPRSYHPVAAKLRPQELEHLLTTLRDQVSRTVSALPDHGAYVARYCGAQDVAAA